MIFEGDGCLRNAISVRLRAGPGIHLPARAGLKNSDCLDCHSDKTLAITNAAGKTLSLFVDEAKLKASAHKTNTCVSCHADVTDKHPDDNVRLQPVRCTTCHEQQTESYNASVHGLALKAGHARCRHLPGLPRFALDPAAGFTGFAAALFPSGGDLRSVPRRRSPGLGVERAWPAMAAGVRDAPTCTDCHSEHKIAALKNASPEVSAEVCSRCHASERLNTKYKLPGDRVKTFLWQLSRPRGAIRLDRGRQLRQLPWLP